MRKIFSFNELAILHCEYVRVFSDWGKSAEVRTIIHIFERVRLKGC